MTPVDIDADGWLDLVVANDTVANFLFHNDRGRFEETAVVAGLAYDNEGAATGAMGIDAARDRNRDETTIVMGNFANEMSSFYVSQNHGEVFTDEAMLSGIGPGTRQALSFGVFFFDYDLDGKLDYLQVGGHIENDINLVQSSQHYEQAAQLYWHCGVQCPRNFVAVTPDTLADLATPRVGRGAAYADIDADGDLDIVITQVAGAAVLLRNDQALGHHWLRIKLRGSAGNQSAIGASVTLHTDGLVQHRRVTPARSYLSQVELPVTFGLGLHDTVEKVVVIWPDGSRSEHRNLKVDTTHVIGQTEP